MAKKPEPSALLELLWEGADEREHGDTPYRANQPNVPHAEAVCSSCGAVACWIPVPHTHPRK